MLKRGKSSPIRWMLAAALALALSAPILAWPAPEPSPQAVARLQRLSRTYRQAWMQLSQNRRQLEDLRQETAEAIRSNMGVVMLRSLADLLPKMMEAPSALGLLQDLLTQALLDTEAKPKQRRQMNGLVMQNLETRQELGARYQEMVQALKAPLERFDDDQPPFRHAKSVWAQPDNKPDDRLERITRRLRVINWMAYELVRLHDQEMERLIQARMQVQAQLRALKAQAPPGAAAPPAGPAPSAPMPVGGELVANASFSQGLKGWTVGGGGYRGARRPKKSLGPILQGKSVRMGACGGTRSISQNIPVTSLNLSFQARMRVQRWSTFDNGTAGGWAALGYAFLDAKGQSLHTVEYYLNPLAPHKAGPRLTWAQIKPALPVPTPWFTVRADLAKVAASLHVDPRQVRRVKIFAIAFGTHEDEVLTVVDFGGFSLKPRSGR